MKEITQYRLPEAAMHVLVLLKRVLAGIVILIATMLFLANAAGLVGIWIVRQLARESVTTLSTFVNDKLGIVDQALARVGARADEGRQAPATLSTAWYGYQSAAWTTREAAEATAKAARSQEEARKAGTISGQYLANTVLFATVLFFAGASGKFEQRRVRVVAFVFAVAVFAFAVVRTAMLPL